MFYRVSTAADKIKDSSSNYINQSGMYEVTIKHVLVSQSQNGSQTIDLNLDYQGQNQTLYSAIRLTNNDGSPNFESINFNKLCIIAGGNEGDEIHDPVPISLPIGKGGEEKECMELQDLAELPVILRIQYEYYKYNDEIRESRRVKNFFRMADKATASEIVNKAIPGTQYEEELKLADKVTYRDDITEEDVKEFKKNRTSQKSEDKEEGATQFKRRSFGSPEPKPPF